jgi:hypothetical protein
MTEGITNKISLNVEKESIPDLFGWFISSPELKAQVSFSDRFLSVVRLSVVWRLSVCLSVVCL